MHILLIFKFQSKLGGFKNIYILQNYNSIIYSYLFEDTIAAFVVFILQVREKTNLRSSVHVGFDSLKFKVN